MKIILSHHSEDLKIKICKEFLFLADALLYRNQKILEIWGEYARL